jgi:zinc transport system permease protein
MLLLFLLTLLSILNGVFGSFIVWKNIVNYFDNFAHSAVFSIIIGHVMHLNEFYTLLVFSVLFSIAICVSILLKIKLHNNLLLIIGSAFIGLASLLNHSHQYNDEHHHHNYEHFENGMLNLFLGNDMTSLKQLDINNYIFLTFVLLVITAVFYKDWLKIIINDQVTSMTKSCYMKYFVFLFSIGLFSIVAIKINGVLLAVGTSVIPIFIVNFFASTPNQIIAYAIVLNLFIVVTSFFICNAFNINYNGFVIIIEFLIFIALSLRQSLVYGKQR